MIYWFEISHTQILTASFMYCQIARIEMDILSLAFTNYSHHNCRNTVCFWTDTMKKEVLNLFL